jgi:hypothetical protein
VDTVGNIRVDRFAAAFLRNPQEKRTAHEVLMQSLMARPAAPPRPVPEPKFEKKERPPTHSSFPVLHSSFSALARNQK